MKERPILFSAPMVRAILAGRKTMTRRVAVPPRGYRWLDIDAGTMINDGGHKKHISDVVCKHGQLGDRLWVRETWAEVGTCDPGLIVYRADYPECVPSQYENVPPASAITWKPSIHMFRRHSRITLEITDVRVERLNDITDDDAVSEGIEYNINLDPIGPCRWRLYGVDHAGTSSPERSFSSLWESINGPGSWDANPYVWVIEFKRVEAA